MTARRYLSKEQGQLCDTLNLNWKPLAIECRPTCSTTCFQLLALAVPHGPLCRNTLARGRRMTRGWHLQQRSEFFINPAADMRPTHQSLTNPCLCIETAQDRIRCKMRAMSPYHYHLWFYFQFSLLIFTHTSDKFVGTDTLRFVSLSSV